MDKVLEQKEKKEFIKSRRRARFHAIQALYQEEINKNSFDELKRQYFTENNKRHKVDWDFFYDLMDGMDKYNSEILEKLIEIIDRPIFSVNIIEKCILKLGIYEIIYRLDIPYQVVISEYIEHNNSLGADNTHPFINAVLENTAKKFRN